MLLYLGISTIISPFSPTLLVTPKFNIQNSNLSKTHVLFSFPIDFSENKYNNNNKFYNEEFLRVSFRFIVLLAYLQI